MSALLEDPVVGSLNHLQYEGGGADDGELEK